MSMPIDEAEVRRIAKLARLKLTPEEIHIFAGQLARILDYVRQIETLDTHGVEPMAHPLPLANVLRQDKPRNGLGCQQVLANAPAAEAGCFRVPAVLDPHHGA